MPLLFSHCPALRLRASHPGSGVFVLWLRGRCDLERLGRPSVPGAAHLLRPLCRQPCLCICHFLFVSSANACCRLLAQNSAPLALFAPRVARDCVMASAGSSPLAAIQQELRQTRAAIRNATKLERRRRQRQVEQGKQTGLRLLVIAVFVLSGECTELAAHCWSMQRCHRGARDEEPSLADGEGVVHAWLSSATAEDLEAARNPETAMQRRAHKAAKQYLADVSTTQWALSMNKKRGHAPATADVYDKRHGTSEMGSELLSPAPIAARSSGAVRMWGMRWRRRWSFKYGKMRIRDRFDVHDLRNKVRPPAPKKASVRDVFWPFYGPLFGGGTWSRIRGQNAGKRGESCSAGGPSFGHKKGAARAKQTRHCSHAVRRRRRRIRCGSGPTFLLARYQKVNNCCFLIWTRRASPCSWATCAATCTTFAGTPLRKEKKRRNTLPDSSCELRSRTWP